MKYGDILSRAFRALKSGTLWLYAAAATLAVAAPFVLVGVVWFVAMRGVRLPIPGPEGELLTQMLGFYAVFLLGGLLCLPILFIVRGGYVHLTDSIIAGAPVSFGDAWSFGARRIGRTFGIVVVLGLIVMGIGFVIMLPFFAILLVAAAAGDNSPGPVFAGVCVGYIYLAIAWIAFGLVWIGLEQVAVRYGLIGGRTFGDAISSAWKAFRAMKGRFVVFTLIILGLQYAYSTLTSFITAPLSLAAMPSSYWQSMLNPSAAQDPTQALAEVSQMLGRLMLIYPISFALLVPFFVFAHAAWTAFFRQLTGLDAPPLPPGYAYGYPPAGYPGGPGYPTPRGYPGAPGYAAPQGYEQTPAYPPPPPVEPLPPQSAWGQAPPIAGYAAAVEPASAPAVEPTPAPVAEPEGVDSESAE